MQIHVVIPIHAIAVTGKVMRASDTINRMNSEIQSSLFISEEEVDSTTEDYYVDTSVSSYIHSLKVFQSTQVCYCLSLPGRQGTHNKHGLLRRALK